MNVCFFGLIKIALCCVCSGRVVYLSLLERPGRLLLSQHHLSLCGDLNALSQRLLQLLDAIRLLTQSVLHNTSRERSDYG